MQAGIGGGEQVKLRDVRKKPLDHRSRRLWICFKQINLTLANQGGWKLKIKLKSKHMVVS